MKYTCSQILSCLCLALGLMLGGANPAHAILMNMYDDGPGYNQYEPLDPIEPPPWEPPVVEPPVTQPPITTPPPTTPPVSTPPSTTPPATTAPSTGYKVQGDPANCGSAQPTIYSTVACPGNTPDANQIIVGNFPDNPTYSKCVKINNNSAKSYFIPLRTYREWIAFYNAATSSGSQLGMTVLDCSATINGSCGSATAPSTTALSTSACTSGSTSTMKTTGTGWTWSCLGSNGGTSATCSATAQCPTGQSWNGTACACPSGQSWDGTQCVTPTVCSTVTYNMVFMGVYTSNSDTDCSAAGAGYGIGGQAIRPFWNAPDCTGAPLTSPPGFCVTQRQAQDARSVGCGGNNCIYCRVIGNSCGASGGGGKQQPWLNEY